jgi:hypothetical protein
VERNVDDEERYSRFILGLSIVGMWSTMDRFTMDSPLWTVFLREWVVCGVEPMLSLGVDVVDDAVDGLCSCVIAEHG